MATTTKTVTFEDLVNNLVDTNQTLLSRYVKLVENNATMIVEADQGALQGETEELVRLILETGSSSFGNILNSQQTVQLNIAERLFPAPM